MRYFPAGLVGLIDPAGEMWSVVTESPNTARALAARMPVRWSGRGEKPSKYGGSWMYVLFASQAYTSPAGAGVSFPSGATPPRTPPQFFPGNFNSPGAPRGGVRSPAGWAQGLPETGV